MAFKLFAENGRDFPALACDVCGGGALDIYSDLASGTRGTFSAPGPVVVHHASCPTTEPLHMTIAEFLGLFMRRNRVGDLSERGGVEKLTFTAPVADGFEP